MQNRDIVYAVVNKNTGEIDRSRIYLKKPTKKWFYGAQNLEIVTYELKEIKRE